jgi:hypothetical protein
MNNYNLLFQSLFLFISFGFIFYYERKENQNEMKEGIEEEEKDETTLLNKIKEKDHKRNTASKKEKLEAKQIYRNTRVKSKEIVLSDEQLKLINQKQLLKKHHLQFRKLIQKRKFFNEKQWFYMSRPQ